MSQVGSRQPVFLLQIVSSLYPHDVVRLPAGGVLERDLIDLITSHMLSKGVTDALVQDLSDELLQNILKRGVGFWRTEDHVRRAIIAGVQESFDEFPTHHGAMERLVSSALADAIASLKVESAKAV